MSTLAAPEHNWLVHRDLAADRSTLEVIDDRGTVRFEDIDLVVQTQAVERYASTADDFGTPAAETVWERRLARGDWQIRTVTRTVVTAGPTDFRLHATLDAFEMTSDGEKRVCALNWDESIPRDLL